MGIVEIFRVIPRIPNIPQNHAHPGHTLISFSFFAAIFQFIAYAKFLCIHILRVDFLNQSTGKNSLPYPDFAIT